MAWWMIAAALAGGTAAQDGMAGMAGKVAAPACAATPAPLSADYAAWRAMTATDAALSADAAPSLAIGTAARVTLRPTPQLRFAAAMKHDGTPASFGGLLAFSVGKAGRYHVALGAGAWIDVVRGGMTLPSAAHGRGPECTGIRKVVDFDLAPGAYLLQIAGNEAPTLGVMVAPAGG